jgi:hypothetical protein
MDFTNGSWPEMFKFGILAIALIFLLARLLLRG